MACLLVLVTNVPLIYVAYLFDIFLIYTNSKSQVKHILFAVEIFVVIYNFCQHKEAEDNVIVKIEKKTGQTKLHKTRHRKLKKFNMNTKRTMVWLRCS